MEERLSDKLRGAIGVEVLLARGQDVLPDLVCKSQDVGQRLADAVLGRAGAHTAMTGAIFSMPGAPSESTST
jgi:hypothetical protein